MRWKAINVHVCLEKHNETIADSKEEVRWQDAFQSQPFISSATCKNDGFVAPGNRKASAHAELCSLIGVKLPTSWNI